MKKLKPLLFLSLWCMSSCFSSKELREERKSFDFKNWKNEYKDRAFCLCILKGYEDAKVEKLLVDKDRSFYNVLGSAIFDKSLDSIINMEVKAIRLDSINKVGHYPEDLKNLYQKRAVIEHCVEFYKSKRLQMQVNKQQKKWKSIKNILDEIHNKIPTF